MKYIGFDGRVYPINFKEFMVYETSDRQSSSLHSRARAILRRMYPADILLQEVTLPGSRRGANTKSLYVDLMIPSKRLVVEVHGEQHYNFNPFFFKDKKEFALAKKRDLDKIAWCELNGLTIVELPYNETDDEWTTRIKETIRGNKD